MKVCGGYSISFALQLVKTFTPSIGSGLRISVGLMLAAGTATLIANRSYYVRDVTHPSLGRVPKPGQVVQWHIEGDGTSHWTSNGVRRLSLPAPSEGPPLLLVGDSFTVGYQVSDHEHFGHILERMLFASNTPIPVVTCPRGGNSAADYVAKASYFRTTFSPRWVIIQVGAADFLEEAWSLNGPGSARFVKEDEKRGLVGVRSTPVGNEKLSQMKRLEERFPRLLPYSFARRRIEELRRWIRTERRLFRAETPIRARDPDESSMLSCYPIEAELQLLAAAYDQRLTLLFLPPFDPASPNTQTKTERFFRNLATTHDIRFVSLGEKFPELAAKGLAPYGFENTRFNYGHWNRYGHRAAAELLFKECQELENNWKAPGINN